MIINVACTHYLKKKHNMQLSNMSQKRINGTCKLTPFSILISIFAGLTTMSNRSCLLGCNLTKKSIISQEWLFFQEKITWGWDLCNLESSSLGIMNFSLLPGAYLMTTPILLHIMNVVNKEKLKLS